MTASIDHIGIGGPGPCGHPPRTFPEYGEHAYATYFLDPHGIMLEVACHAPDDARAGPEADST